MTSFHDLKIKKELIRSLDEMNFVHPTPIQEQTYSTILSGKNIVGVAQTGTGKTLAYSLPLLQSLAHAKDRNPRVLILVPTRELVLQVEKFITELAQYLFPRVVGVYGGTNINTQKKRVAEGVDVLVATPGRLYDLVICSAVSLKRVKKVVIDEVDVMLDLGFRFQLRNIFDLIPEKRQNIMFSATMTEEVDALIDDYFIVPEKISIAVSGTRLNNIEQASYTAPNFYSKINLLSHILMDDELYGKVLLFCSSKRNADRLYENLEMQFGSELGIVHANKSQNFRLKTIKKFEEATIRILITTDVMARGLDLDKITHVINMDTPRFPENYMHRIGRTGRLNELGNSILLFSDAEKENKEQIEALMDYEIPLLEIPEEVEFSQQLTPEERADKYKGKSVTRNTKSAETGLAFHEKKAKNRKVNLGGKYKREIKGKYKKKRTRGDKNINQRKKKK